MIAGIGTDIISVSEFKLNFMNGFQDELKYPSIKNVFTQKEQYYCWDKKYPEQHFAARFAAKEALIKGIMGGIKDGMRNIEICRYESGGPYIRLHGDLKEKYCLFEFKVSMSHCKGYATATVIAQMK